MGARARRQRCVGSSFRSSRADARQLTSRALHAELEAREGLTGFSLRFDACPNTLVDVLDALGFEALRPVSLECGGSANGTCFQGFVTRWKGSTTEADRRDLSIWLEKHHSVLDFDLGHGVPY